jgi:hypothetical protein
VQQKLMGLHCFALLRIAWPGGRCIRLGTDLKTHSKDSIAKAPNPTDNTESTSRINATEPNATIGMLTYMFYLNDEGVRIHSIEVSDIEVFAFEILSRIRSNTFYNSI